MRQIAREHQSNNPDAPEISPHPCEYFDLIGGTSTGGLIALMLGRLTMEMQDFFFSFLQF
jgi:patatin-like phospholipase/acyl hydrolase